MNLAFPPPSYDQTDQTQTRAAIEREDAMNQKKNADVVLSGDANDIKGRLILVSPNGSRYRAIMSNAGVLTWAAI